MLAAIRRHAWVVALTAIVAGVTAGVYSATLDPVYRAEASLLVGQRENAVAPALGAGGSVEPVMQTMEDLLTSDLVAAGVVRRLEGEVGPGDVLDPLSVTSRPESTVMHLRYDAEAEEQATQTSWPPSRRTWRWCTTCATRRAGRRAAFRYGRSTLRTVWAGLIRRPSATSCWHPGSACCWEC
ncbi:MAG: Wzz/FepE/Etk N-terminal domain-containing protein [Thermoleophilia bacterium]